MPRRARQLVGGMIYHVLNRGNLKATIFYKEGDYAAFEKTVLEAAARNPVEIFDWCLMPNHWHLVVRPRSGRDLSEFMRWLTVTHAQRWRAHTHTEGEGHLYQGRFKSFPIQEDGHFLRVCRYVERNALRSGLVTRAEEWRWGSLWLRMQGKDEATARLLSPWPVDCPRNWLGMVNRAMNPAEEEAIRKAIVRGQPYGSEAWQATTAKRLGLQYPVRQRGRPRLQK